VTQRAAQFATIGLLLLLVGMLGWGLRMQGRVIPPTAEEIATAIRADKVNLTIENEWSATVRKTTINWQDANGKRKSTVVETAQLEGETSAELARRHLVEVGEQEAAIVAAGGTIL